MCTEGQIQDVRKEGETVLNVSHSNAHTLCLVLFIKFRGPPGIGGQGRGAGPQHPLLDPDETLDACHFF